MQRLSQIPGVGQVVVGGGSLPGVRVEVNPTQLNAYGLGLRDIAILLSQQNANLAKGQLSDGKRPPTLQSTISCSRRRITGR